MSMCPSIFFFKQKTAYELRISDWSSDVCSSDLGIVDHEAGTRDARRLGGLATLMPITATIATLAGLSMAGFAPLNGFLSKEMMPEEATNAVCACNPSILPAVVTLGAVFSAASVDRTVWRERVCQ